MNIDLDAEVEILKKSFDAELNRLHSNLKSVSSILSERIGFGASGPSAAWTDRFNPLTLLYPLLQAEGLGRIELETARQAALIHLLFLVHSIIEDRQLDSQVRLDRAEILLNKAIYRQSNVLLECFVAERMAEARHWMQYLEFRYAEGQTSSYGASVHGVNGRASLGRFGIAAPAAGKGSLGFAGTLGMLLASGYPAECIEEILEAFDDLVVALQWADDNEDWSEDFLGGQDNLLLTELARSGFDLRQLEKNETSLQLIHPELLARGIYDAALRNAEILFFRSRNFQEAHGCKTLSRLISKKLDLIASRREQLCGRMIKELLGLLPVAV